MKYFEKQAKLDMNDVEDYMGFYFRDKDEPRVRSLVDRELGKSFALRHPILTGIPTLGIAPTVAKDNALSNISRSMVRKDEWVRRQNEKAIATLRKQELEDAKIEARMAEANRYTNAVGAANGLLNSYLSYKTDNR